MDYILHAQHMHKALATKVPYTFRHGKVLVTIRGVSQDKNMLSVTDASASFDGVDVPLDLPLQYVNMSYDDTGPLLSAQWHIAMTVRHIGGK